MLLAIVGTRSSGKSQVLDYYVSTHGFLHVKIKQVTLSSLSSRVLESDKIDTTVTISTTSQLSNNTNALIFPSATELLQYVTTNWQLDFVTIDLCTHQLIRLFVRRPFFMLVSVDAPLTIRFLRSGEKSLEEFVEENDRVMFGVDVSNVMSLDSKDPSCLSSLQELVSVHIFNHFKSIAGLHEHLKELNLLDPERLRPGWDAYFMTLASLASQRSNCMKRRVGAVLVRENRVVSTGYNGTPRGVRNCNQGGCSTCNGTKADVAVECVCLHAEENALLEAGRERVGTNAILYCNTCPCLRCTIKIIQTGVKAVVYNLSYKVDEMSALLFQEAGVELRRYTPPKDS